jgi:alkylation response protein AidB-like acyl-CoA dehydrogenase
LKPEPEAPPDQAAALRREVRTVIAGSGVPRFARCDAWMRGHDPQFTAELARHGLIGVSWPGEFGGRDAGSVDRLVVTEELLRAGAPVAAHWIADRQIGPAILRYGSRDLQERFLPVIAAGRITFCLGMSEPESGSDLAAVRTRAVRDGDTFRLTGRKIWTSHAHRSTHAYVLARTGEEGDRHGTLTEFVVDLGSAGIEIRPIYDLSGEHHFNEMVFDQVEVPAANVLGSVGAGWAQVTEQLAFERGGMERVLSTYPLLARIIDEIPDADPRALGRLVARLHTLRAMAFRIAQAMDAGRAPVRDAALLKFLGTTFESDVVEFARDTLLLSPDPGAGGIEGLLADGITATPGATLRGGATEVLLGIIAKQQLRAAPGAGPASELAEVVGAALRGVSPATEDEPGKVWTTAVELGWTGIGTAEETGGSGGSLRDLADLAGALGASAQPAPVIETALAGRVRAAARRVAEPGIVATLGLGGGLVASSAEGGLVLRGRLTRVPWARAADSLVVAARGTDGEMLIDVPLPAAGVTITPGRNLAGEPRDTVVFDDVRLAPGARCGDQSAVDAARGETILVRTAATVGALRAALTSVSQHVQLRHQFGRPLAAFQAVAHLVARMAAELAAAEVALEEAVAESEAGTPGWRTCAAVLVSAHAATAVAKPAHQVLGAMGITQEHELHLFTLRLWSWRDELAAEKTLAGRLGQAAARAGEHRTWSWVVQDGEALDPVSPWAASSGKDS